MKVHVLAALAAGLVLAAAAPGEEKAKGALEKFQGNWSYVTVERDGKADDTSKDARLTVTGNKFTVKAGDKLLRAGVLKPDPTKTPKAIDVTYTEGPDKGKTLHGIYELTGDTWKVCYGEERPTELTSKPGSGHILIVIKREKP